MGGVESCSIRAHMQLAAAFTRRNRNGQFKACSRAALARPQAAERQFAKRRRVRFKQKGIRFGRKPKLTDAVRARIRKLRQDGMAIGDIQTNTGLGRSTVYRALEDA